MNSERITVVGAGLVGSVMACYLCKEGFEVTLIERRSDPRKNYEEGGRSINLALSRRGIAALEEIDMASAVADLIIPMHGRMMHDVHGSLTFQPYGKEGQYINSVSRNGLNCLLIEQSERLGCRLLFDTPIHEVDFEHASVTSEHGAKIEADYIIAADGAFSAVRSEMMRTTRFNYSQHYVSYGYKEICMPPNKDGSHKMEINALHIWPRGNFMLIALPNLNGSYTCTLFLPFEGSNSFEQFSTDNDILDFFKKYFPDVLPLIPGLLEDFHENPTSSLVTVRCFPWVTGRALLIGDASHAIVPFYGQGMNAGFEDCRILTRYLRKYEWAEAIQEFQKERKPDADAIADLALHNFIEMRDLVADEEFLLRKKIEARLHEAFPETWVPLYSMVTFHDQLRYSEALNRGRQQQEIMEKDCRKNFSDLFPNIHSLGP
jgi:kynurenine 3-monooxygenase